MAKQQQVFEVWEYGYGDSGRFRFKAETAEEAIERFLKRQIIGGQSFRKYVHRELGYTSIKLCVKNPHTKGTPKQPNYPEVRDTSLTGERYDS